MDNAAYNGQEYSFFMPKEAVSGKYIIYAGSAAREFEFTKSNERIRIYSIPENSTVRVLLTLIFQIKRLKQDLKTFRKTVLLYVCMPAYMTQTEISSELPLVRIKSMPPMMQKSINCSLILKKIPKTSDA